MKGYLIIEERESRQSYLIFDIVETTLLIVLSHCFHSARS